MTKRIKRYPGTLVLRGSTHWLHLSVGGKRYYFTIPTVDRREAETFAINKHAELTRASERHRWGYRAPSQCLGLSICLSGRKCRRWPRELRLRTTTR